MEGLPFFAEAIARPQVRGEAARCGTAAPEANGEDSKKESAASWLPIPFLNPPRSLQARQFRNVQLLRAPAAARWLLQKKEDLPFGKSSLFQRCVR